MEKGGKFRFQAFFVGSRFFTIFFFYGRVLHNMNWLFFFLYLLPSFTSRIPLLTLFFLVSYTYHITLLSPTLMPPPLRTQFSVVHLHLSSALPHLSCMCFRRKHLCGQATSTFFLLIWISIFCFGTGPSKVKPE